MVRGTRNLLGNEAKLFRLITNNLISFIESQGYNEFIPSLLAEQDIFVNKAGKEVLSQIYSFKDKGNRDICLIPEVTAIVQNLYINSWQKSMPKPVKLWYLTKCFRYERPQQGRYREFWQFGVENLGGNASKEEMIELLVKAISSIGIKNFNINQNVKRGLDYYVEDGFEASVNALGAQKQIAGGGRYDNGIGWALGVDRLMLCEFTK